MQFASPMIKRPKPQSTFRSRTEFACFSWKVLLGPPVPPSPRYRLLAEKVGGLYRHAEAKTIFQQLLDVSADVAVEEDRVVVTLHKRSHNPFLVASRLADLPTGMPWFGNKQLFLRFA